MFATGLEMSLKVCHLGIPRGVLPVVIQSCFAQCADFRVIKKGLDPIPVAWGFLVRVIWVDTDGTVDIWAGYILILEEREHGRDRVCIDTYAEKSLDVEFSSEFEGRIEEWKEVRVGKVSVGIGPGRVVDHVGFVFGSEDFSSRRFQ